MTRRMTRKCEFCESKNPTIILITDQSKGIWILDWVKNFTFSKNWNATKPTFKKFKFCPVCGKELKNG